MLERHRVIQLLRIASQTGFFLLFILLLLGAHRPEGETLGAVERIFHFDPLLGLTTFLASRAFFLAFFWSIVTVVVTLAFGRYVCGWVCPLGSLHHFFSFLFGRENRNTPQPEESDRLVWKYWILVVVLAGSVLTLDLAGFLDPLSFLYRSFVTSVLPATVLATGAVIGLLDRTGLTSLGSGWSQLVQDLTLNTTFRQGLVVGLIFVGVVLLNMFRERFWCRYICPAGALLGLLARWNLVKLRIDRERCIECNICNEVCPSQANPYPNESWSPAECFYCYTCASECPVAAISLPLEPTPSRAPSVDLSRRGLVLASTLGLVAAPLEGLTASERPLESLIRPPGALPERQFLARCIKCGECLKVCPTNGLHHASAEAGLLGIWSPMLVPRIGYCEYFCSLCSQVCPTGAIQELTIKAKIETKIGSAWIKKHRCIPFSSGEPCRVCAERCPTSPKAIQMVDVDVVAPDGAIVAQYVPVVDNEVCIGCGVCETKCPVVDEPAIYCTNAGESRSDDDRALSFGPPQ